MSAALVTFFVLAGWCTLAAFTVFSVRSPQTACIAMCAMWLGLTGLAVMLSAPLVALLMIVLASTFAVVAATWPTQVMAEPSSRSWFPSLSGGLAVAVFGFILLGTAVRQTVTYGVELERVQRRLGGLRFDSMDAAVQAMFGRAGVVPCLLVVAALLVLVVLGRRKGS